jgi:2-polyprenyl-3-methyl-5-hydroxy-6-metoxy-1,4-benzoquinol methylase
MVLCVMTYLAADQRADGMLTFGVLVCQERLEHTPKPEKAIQSSTRRISNVMTWI